MHMLFKPSNMLGTETYGFVMSRSKQSQVVISIPKFFHILIHSSSKRNTRKVSYSINESPFLTVREREAIYMVIFPSKS